MTDLAIIYFNFWAKAIPYIGGFLPAYPEYTVPANTPMPYLTYTLTRNDMFDMLTAYTGGGLDQVRIWTRSTNIQQLVGLLDYVEKAVPSAGTTLFLPENKGAITLYRGTPFIQRQPVDEPDLQVGYINIQIRSYIY